MMEELTNFKFKIYSAKFTETERQCAFVLEKKRFKFVPV